MSYGVVLDEKLVVPYLYGPYLDLPDSDIERILDFLEAVGKNGDEFRGDSSRRIKPGSS